MNIKKEVCILCGSEENVFMDLCENCENEQYEVEKEKDYRFRANEWD